ncbi:hypothetical protein [Cupriavidus neocaledonicus]|uniref:Uncharacterized protein n=1 Tax=Cupriavidus neocaledonicus TaxID=1040979 RepID=A0A375HCB9_9BURK|nr:hypothetical protein [Cupriavidus neocaledonicus]SOZ36554.1 hypothetical protein CBM2605_A290050 [Cupriavidus neocaledonicus]SPD48538.1 protein of unknown function [Cupriavidus neocaledonicus]
MKSILFAAGMRARIRGPFVIGAVNNFGDNRISQGFLTLPLDSQHQRRFLFVVWMKSQIDVA